MLDAVAKSRLAQRDAEDAKNARELASKITSGHTSVTTTTAPTGPSYALPGAQRSAVDQALIQSELAKSFPGLKPQQAETQWNKFNAKQEAMAEGKQSTQDMRAELDKYKDSNDVPGFGVIASHLPNAAASREGNRMRQLVNDVAMKYLKATVGRVTDAEMHLITKQLVGDGSYDSMSSGLETAERAIAAKEQEHRRENPRLSELHDYLGRRQGDVQHVGAQGFNEQEEDARAAAGEDGTETEE